MDSRKKNSDRHLIAEQPGLRILVTGLVLAFFIGYTLKSYLSPARVKAQIEKAASHIHKDVKVSFDSAEFILSEGILPRFSIVITNIKMESSQVCWMAPTLNIDELRLPLSVWGLITGRAPVESVEAQVVTLNLREEFKNCSDKDHVEQVTQSQGSKPLVTLSPSEAEEKYRNDVRSLYVREFNIAADKYPQYRSQLLDFSVRVKSFEPRVIEVRAKTHLLKDNQVGDYLSHANLYMEYKESPDKILQSHFFGNWREGHYSFIANYNLSDHRLTVETDLKHIPLSQILSILQKYDLASKELNGKQVWMSAKARWVGPIEDLKNAPLNVRDLNVEGDLGEMRVDQMEFTRLSPIEYKPIRIDVRRLDVEKLLVLLNRPADARILGALGQFSGVAEIRSDQMMRLQGEHKGLEFIFSNKSERQLQVIDRMMGEIALRGDQWLISVNRVEPRGGSFLGEVKLTADRDFKNIEVKSHVDELAFTSAVQNLMTQGGEVGSMSLDGELKIQNGQLDKAKGLLRVQNMRVEGVEFVKTRAQFEGHQGELTIGTQIQKMSVSEKSPTSNLMRTIAANKYWNNGTLNISDVNGKFVLQKQKTLSWKGFQGHLDKSTLVKVDGSWDQDGVLKGGVHVNEGRQSKKWIVEGTRDEPRLILDNAPKRTQRR
ncbi:hypothetical protein [Bdellovibrio sp. HCB2-146]|uniref:hypothetical protein n=1 Tax=Bdellovibrio sp. HCB2-146 TaxID=3394362 RepID=UPI0039BD1C50